ncbi:HIRAN domain-containing protein [Halodurantibacterium flavum]|uniref:HIRAN domain-containing protein n=1 Tax=Halodurantibacterium flavum TaxID=1382802 RepID=A0ABW4S597_9RHOB
MDRRRFIASGVVAAPVLGAGPLYAGSGGARGRQDTVALLSTRIVNRDRFSATPLPQVGTRLALRREAGDYDPRRISVLTPEGATIGYLPPVQVGVLAALMDAGASAYATLTARGVDLWLEPV